MHVIFRESHGLEETAQPVDLQQTPADMVVLSFSDSDLGAFSVGWHNAKEDLPSLRLANLAALQHPLSVDTYIEQTLRDAKAVLVRLIGGMPYWSYGLQQLRAVAEENGIALAVLAADGRADSQLDEISTLPSFGTIGLICRVICAPENRPKESAARRRLVAAKSPVLPCRVCAARNTQTGGCDKFLPVLSHGG